ncbi:MAG: class I SAM-dependent methyltransferase [Candidatus Brocadiaceae bacterium]|nr:class I SAM-dependent methyltransferase [Candidatus Brocadiaceae bacterium]
MQQVNTCIICKKNDTVFYDKIKKSTFVICKHCNLIYRTNVPPENQFRKNYFFTNDNTSNKVVNARLKLYKRELAFLQKYKSSGKFFDVGCGLGRFLNFLPSSYEKYGCDISPYAIDIAKTKYGFTNVYLNTFESLDVDENFDIVYFRASLHNTYNPLTSLIKASSILKPDGLLVIAHCNNSSGLSGRLLKSHSRPCGPICKFFFNEISIAHLLDKAGFKLRKIANLSYWGTGYEGMMDYPNLIYSSYKFRVISPFLGMLNIKYNQDNILGPPLNKNFLHYYANKKK